MLHVVVVCMQVHAVVLRSVELVHGMRTARIYIAVAFLICVVVVDILILLGKVSQVWRRLVLPSPHLEVDPLKRLVGPIAIGVEVRIDAVVPWQRGPMASVRSVFVYDNAVVQILCEELVQVAYAIELRVLNNLSICAEDSSNILVA